MSPDPYLNLFSGEQALNDFYDPDQGPLVPLVELPERVNPYKKDGIQIFAKLMSHLPATNVKSLPALNMILRGQEKGKITDDTHTLVEYSSGSTIISMGILGNIYGIPNTKAYLSNKTTPAKLDLLHFFPEPQDPNGGIRTANFEGEQPGHYNPDQYSNTENCESHMRWTGPQIMKQLPNLSVFAASMRTSDAVTMLERLQLKSQFVLEAAAMLIALQLRCQLAFESLALSRNGLLVGPSSGLALVGLFKFLNRKKAAGELDSLRNEEGNIPCVFICCDQPFQYILEYFDRLGPSYFLPIRNSELIGIDTRTKDFAAAHLVGARNLPTSARAAPNPYKHTATMVEQFALLDARLGAADAEFGAGALEGVVLTLSYKGHVGRLAMSVLRSRGVTAHCVTGGVEAWEEDGLWAQSCALTN
ncbi:tryptophan synthase beta subunit-like PLP-dependent enzyme [Mycena belliarum]|uniref:Tryptophan synthase beta subunit-like PLP-dependent enzyme n=1 Tax=Mycena belliarum TaxID=1033014 RepID=A0AAD6XRQ0_9AGAR|nr:tryptophan synthase beta subunit-like PLP-dependent enzyme [Mycena belliae]